LNISPADLNQLLTVDQEAWKKEAEDIANSYAKFGSHLPAEIASQLENLKKRLA
jgi:phosphoenolpyruvate carboxykinase (GTP)